MDRLETTAKVGDKVHYTFGKSDPMSTYLFSMVAGKFESVTENPGVFDMTFLYRETAHGDIQNIAGFDIWLVKTREQCAGPVRDQKGI